MTHIDDWEHVKNIPYKDIIKELYNILEDNQTMFKDNNDDKSILLQAIYKKVSKC